jgi:hypothetical protein
VFHIKRMFYRCFHAVHIFFGVLKNGLKKEVIASYTVEAAGVMAIIFFVIMILLNQAFHVRGETVGKFVLHEEVERARHQIENKDEQEIIRRSQGIRWGLELTVPIFRPENSLRMWSLAE